MHSYDISENKEEISISNENGIKEKVTSLPPSSILYYNLMENPFYIPPILESTLESPLESSLLELSLLKEIPIDNQTFVKPSTPTNTENIGHEIQNETPFPFEAETPIIKTPIIQMNQWYLKLKPPPIQHIFGISLAKLRTRLLQHPQLK